MRSLYFAYPSLVGGSSDWAELCRHAVALGFDALATATTRQDIFDTSLCGGIDVAALAKLAAEQGLGLSLDLRLDSVAGDGEPHRRDPRFGPAERGRRSLPEDRAERERWLDAAADRAAELMSIGVAGFRCVHADRLAAGDLARFVARAEQSAGKAVEVLAELDDLGNVGHLDASAISGLVVPASMLLGLGRGGLDQASRQVPRLIAAVEVPFGARSARVRGDAEIGQRQARLLLGMGAALADGLLVPVGFEWGARERVPFADEPRSRLSDLRAGASFDIADAVRDANRFVLGRKNLEGGALDVLTAEGLTLAVATRHHPAADRLRLAVANRALDRMATLEAETLAAGLGEFLPLRAVAGSHSDVGPETALRLKPGEVAIFEGRRADIILSDAAIRLRSAEAAVKAPRLVIEAVTPSVDGGRYPVKRIVGETVTVECDAFGEGHDRIAVALLWRAGDEAEWHRLPMAPLGNDRYGAELPLARVGRHLLDIEAWRDEFAIFREELVKKHEAGLNLSLELEEGRRLVERVASEGRDPGAQRLKPLLDELNAASDGRRLDLFLAPGTAELMAAADPRPFAVRLDEPVPLDAERRIAGFASWYELFPRSQSGDPTRHATFDDVARRLPAIRDMGFDVVYFPPIHPIGRTNRKGRNNSLSAGPDDPGSPYAIGSAEGGHDAIHPELGGFEAFRRLVAEASRLGLEIALDLAIQASPDHPWLTEHPEWFDWRPDGSIKYAENPPKKYEDIVNVDFYTDGAKPSLWSALRDTIMLWVGEGVRLFRVDNPHTKPFPFWEWVIAEVRREHPDVVFLSEAFTRPKVMYRLAKIGFSQSYTYFTWRNTKWELTQYLTELTTTAPKDFFRPHFFVNTHDINPDFLQNAPRPAFLIRAALATTLSGLWGMYSGFELCEGRPDAKRKEYADSEKYELKAWDWDRPGNIIREIAMLNRIRRANPSLQSHLGITFLTAWNDNVLLFEKATPTRNNVVLVAVSLDPHAAQEADIEVPLWRFGLSDAASVAVEDLVRGPRFRWSGKMQRIRLDPAELPFSIWRLSVTERF